MAFSRGVSHAAGLVSRPSDSRNKFRAGHPVWRRCSSLKYSQYSHSSRLASRAPRPELMQRITGTGHQPHARAPSRDSGLGRAAAIRPAACDTPLENATVSVVTAVLRPVSLCSSSQRPTSVRCAGRPTVHQPRAATLRLSCVGRVRLLRSFVDECSPAECAGRGAGVPLSMPSALMSSSTSGQ